MNEYAPPSSRPKVAVALAAAGALVVLVCLYVLPWWSSDFSDNTFLSARSELAGIETNDWYDHLYTSFFSVGFLVLTAAVIVSPFLIASGGRTRWFALVAPVAAVWQIVGVKGATLINTTAAPLVGPIVGGILILIALGVVGSSSSPGTVPGGASGQASIG